jgi:hypothetical protein
MCWTDTQRRAVRTSGRNGAPGPRGAGAVARSPAAARENESRQARPGLRAVEAALPGRVRTITIEGLEVPAPPDQEPEGVPEEEPLPGPAEPAPEPEEPVPVP